jgi:CARDB
MRTILLFAVVVFGTMAPLSDALQKPSRSDEAQNANVASAPNAVLRPDLIADGLTAKLPMFRVRNGGSANAGASIVQVECRTQSSNAPCLPNQHYVNVPSQIAPPLPAGTHMTAPHVWRVPVSELATGAEKKFALGVWPKSSEAAGLRFRICADIASTVFESNESNNCSELLFTKPA